jgi:phosphoribosylanthranilate isomerase
MDRGARTDIKICGISTAQTLETAIAAGASHVGFIFFPKSPRHVTRDQAAGLVERIAGRAQAVAVTVDADDDELDAIVAAMRPQMLQLHGKESPQRAAQLRARHGLPVMKAFPVRDKDDLSAIPAYRAVVDRFLFDARPPAGAELPGGNGVSFDWRLLAALDPSLPYMLSGGINPENVREAIELLHPPGIDVSSGVESAPGVKDAGLIRRLFEEAARAVPAKAERA